MRRLLIIAAVTILLLGLGVIAYFYFFAGGSAGVEVTVPSSNVSLPSAEQGTAPATGTTAGGGGTQNGPTNAPVAVSARLVKISAGPVVPGAAVVSKTRNASSTPSSTSPGTSDTTVTYIERTSGNVFSYSTNTKTSTRTSNKTIPGIQSAAWLPDGSTAFVRYLSGADFSTVNTYALPANGIGGFFLPQNLSSIAVSSSGILTLASGVNGSTASITRIDGSRSTSVFSTALSALRVSFAGKSQYLATTKPTATLPGDAFLVDAAGRFSRIAGPLHGLAALASPSGKWVLVSYTLDSEMQLALVETATGEIIPLPVATIADKCVWTTDDSVIYCGIPVSPPSSVYPDDWYQGAVQFSDRIWKIQVSGRYAQLVLDFPRETDSALDTLSLAVDALNTTLVFVNKSDESLWSYSL